MSLQMDMNLQGGALIVRLSGELDHHSAESLKMKLEQAIEQGHCRHIILSLKNLSFMDSSGLGVILGRYKQISALGGKMVVCDISEAIYRLFEMSGLFKILTIQKDEASALSSLEVAL